VERAVIGDPSGKRAVPGPQWKSCSRPQWKGAGCDPYAEEIPSLNEKKMRATFVSTVVAEEIPAAAVSFAVLFEK
jgi:hypothetical protein